MTKLMELIDAYAQARANNPAPYRGKESRAAVVAEVEKLERDAARWQMLAEMETRRTGADTIRYYIEQPEKLDYVIHLKRHHDKQAMEATNDQSN